jgi:hypothetical protein
MVFHDPLFVLSESKMKWGKFQVAGLVTAMILSLHVRAAGPIACVLHKRQANDKKRLHGLDAPALALSDFYRCLHFLSKQIKLSSVLD